MRFLLFVAGKSFLSRIFPAVNDLGGRVTKFQQVDDIFPTEWNFYSR